MRVLGCTAMEAGMNRYIYVVLAAWLTTPAPSAAQSDTEARIQRIQQGLAPPVLVQGETPAMQPLAARMAELKVPGVSIAVIHQSRIEWARGFGVTRTNGPPVTEHTLFQAASISKPVFALAVLHLVDAGKLNLDANVNDYLKDWKLPDNDLTRQSKVTLRGILSHSAGLTVHGFAGYAADGKIPSTTQALDGTPPANSAAVRVDIPPGSRFRYSGGGFVLAQQLLTDVTGTPLPKFLYDSVLAPLGMTHSTFEQPLPAARLSEVAMPYRGDGNPLQEGPHVYPEIAAAGLWTTPTDLAHYALGVQAALAGKSKKVISAKTARAMLTPVIDQQGLGLRISGSTARKYFMHGGANAGYRCLLIAYEDGEGAIVMTNSDSGGELMDEVMRSIAHVYQWPDFAPPTRTLVKQKPESLRRFLGVYELNEGSLYVVRMDGDRLVGNVLGNSPVALFPSSDHELFARDVNVIASFVVGAEGSATAVRHNLNGWERTGQRIEESRSRQILATAERTAQRIKEQKPAPGSDAAIRKLFAGLAIGKADYDSMTPQFAELTRQNLTRMQPIIANLGALKNLTFKSVGDNGADEYDADFEKGALRIYMGLDEQGRIAGVNFVPR
jgi:CubicO group peptidase (beta-lactamase class C family)